jgi:membrane protease YdiL (CAAX protease family)
MGTERGGRCPIHVHAKEPTSTDGLFAFFAIACALTWLLATPVALAWMHHTAPPPYAVACAGLSAFGPLVAALVIAGRQRRLGEVFGRWRTNPLWIVLALVTPMTIHTVAAALSTASGFRPSQWLHPLSSPEQIAALVVFPLGEEFGWRGFAYPRMVKRYGAVKGSLGLGAVWGLWHLFYSISPTTGHFDLFMFGYEMVELPLYSLIIAWLFEHANRSMGVAVAVHAGAHLDQLEHAPRSEIGLHAAHIAVVVLLAAGAARWLHKRELAQTRK